MPALAEETERAHVPGASLSHREIARRFFSYASMYWKGPTRMVAWGYTLALLAIILGLVATAVGITRWTAVFFDAIENKDADAIFSRLSVIAGLGLLSASLYGLWTFTGERMKVSWRECLTSCLIRNWLESDKRNHHSLRLSEEVDSPEFRIAEDVRMSIEPLVDFATTFINALGSAAAFIAILWTVGGSYALWDGLTVPGYMVWLALAYSIVCSLAIRYLGNPIVSLAERKNAYEALLRGDMVRYGEKPPEIVEREGNSRELGLLKQDMEAVFSRWRRLADYHGRVGVLTHLNAVFMPVVPLLATAPKYFAGELTLGAIVQLSAAFTQVQLALNWYFDHFTAIADWLSNVQRVATLVDVLEQRDHDATE